jgi:hypothetical protein
MKVALIDNMNNNFFSMCRYLRDRGIDAHLFTLPGMHEHFLPENDTFEDTSRLGYIHEFPFATDWVSWLISGVWGTGKPNGMEQYDVIIACGKSMAILSRKKIRVDVFIPYGKDLYDLPFPLSLSNPFKSPLMFNVKRFFLKCIMNWIGIHQKRAICGSRYIISNRSVSLYDNALDRLGRDCLEIGIPMVYNKELSTVDIGRWGYLSDYDFVVFNHSRHVWKTNIDNLSDFDIHGGIKRNDKVINAFSRFVRQTSFKKPVLVLFEYGVDVLASKKLIETLGIGECVRWMPKMSRKFIAQGLRQASLVCDQFRFGFVGAGGASIEALSQGVPLVRNMGRALQDKESKYYQAPIVNALEEDDIVGVFVDYEKDPAYYIQMGKDGLAWFNAELGEGLVDRYIQLINDIYNQKNSVCSL